MLLDTDVLVDLDRQYPAVLAWFAGLTTVPTVPGFSVMELLNGYRNRAEWRKAERFLTRFPVVWPREQELDQMMRRFTGFRLSQGVGMIDALIAATALSRGETLVTFNDRHYRAVPDLRTIQPYQKQPAS